MLYKQSYLLSAGMDGVIKTWEVLSSPTPGMVLKPEPEFAFDKEKAAEEDGLRRAKVMRGYQMIKGQNSCGSSGQAATSNLYQHYTYF